MSTHALPFFRTRRPRADSLQEGVEQPRAQLGDTGEMRLDMQARYARPRAELQVGGAGRPASGMKRRLGVEGKQELAKLLPPES